MTTRPNFEPIYNTILKRSFFFSKSYTLPAELLESLVTTLQTPTIIIAFDQVAWGQEIHSPKANISFSAAPPTTDF